MRRRVRAGVSAAGRTAVGLVRGAEAVLPGGLFRAAVGPVVAGLCVREWVNGAVDWPALRTLPEAFGPRPTAAAVVRSRYELKAGTLARLWPDRLAEPRWQARCRLHGAAAVRGLLAAGRPVVLATLHYGSLTELFHWLRAAGLPVAAVAGSPPDHRGAIRSGLNDRADRANGLAGVPRVFGTTPADLRDVCDFLAAPGRAVQIAVDGIVGTRRHAVAAAGVRFEVSAGAFKLAAITGAVVVPCLWRPARRMGCDIHFADPVPDAVVAGRRFDEAAAHVVHHLLPLIRDRPELAGPGMIRAPAPAGGPV